MSEPEVARIDATVRTYDPDRDRVAVRSAFVELQEHERSHDPRMPAGDEVVDAYLRHLLRNCSECRGTIFVMETTSTGGGSSSAGALLADIRSSSGHTRSVDASGESSAPDFIGYVAVLGHVESEEPDDDPRPYAYLSDLVVLPAHRGKGFGRRLVEVAEQYARDCGAPRIRLSVLARNREARHLYERCGWGDHLVEMEKSLVES